jgi:hypothetical protein
MALTGGAGHCDVKDQYEQTKASMPAKAEKLFCIIKQQFGFSRVCYRDIAKNHNKGGTGMSAPEDASKEQRTADVV